MGLIERFSAPADLDELSAQGLDAWHDDVSRIMTECAGPPHFFNPVDEDAVDHEVHFVRWNAFPARVLQRATSEEGRWDEADGSRDVQDEYCEWSVTRDDDDTIRSVTFTSETPEYYACLLREDPDLLEELYGQFTGESVTAEDLTTPDGEYDPDHPLNVRTNGPIVHLTQDTNTLGAAVALVAQATVLREKDGRPVVNQQELVDCGNLGEPLRNSDPQIASAVNNLVANQFDVTVNDPAGLYISNLVTSGMLTPDGADPQAFWTIERGTVEHALRARFEVPSELGYRVGDIKIGDRFITHGGQLADRVRVKVGVIARPGAFDIVREPCEP
ncbi:MAG TPA: hypothetical protein VIG64_10220 [Actinomycetota bacterium]|jgi:hypothetical protein